MSADPKAEIVYPESDGKPSADNTLHFDWMEKLYGEFRSLFAERPVFIACKLFWYPVEGHPAIVRAPDVMVAFDRPKGHRGSYRQWEEGGIAPQVVFGFVNPNTTPADTEAEFRFYDRHGVEEYFLLDPFRPAARGYLRRDGRLWVIDEIEGFVSPRLGVRFGVAGGELNLFAPCGRKFQTREELIGDMQAQLRAMKAAIAQFEQRRIAAERARVEAERADAAAARAAAERAAKERLAAKFRELGIDPDELLRSAG